MREEKGWTWWETDAGEPSDYAISQLEKLLWQFEVFNSTSDE